MMEKEEGFWKIALMEEVQFHRRINFNGNYTPMGLTKVNYVQGTVYPHIILSF